VEKNTRLDRSQPVLSFFQKMTETILSDDAGPNLGEALRRERKPQHLDPARGGGIYGETLKDFNSKANFESFLLEPAGPHPKATAFGTSASREADASLRAPASSVYSLVPALSAPPLPA
jgi:hypothetical protein